MKRNVILVIPLVLSLGLAACSDRGTAAGVSLAEGGAPMQGELSTVAQDILGIFKLEGTELAVGSAQAATLLPLWQAYRSLSNSDTAAAAELEALKTQMDEALTVEQKDAIEAMSLTPQDMFAMAEKLGVTQGAPSRGDNTDSSSDRPFVFSFDGDGPPGGAPPSGGMPSGGAGGFVMQEGGPSLESGGFGPSMMTQGTPQPGQTVRSGQGDRMSMMLLDPLIKLLKERAGS
jgi:hypothetical protein